MPRRIRAVLLAVLAAFALDLVDADCISGVWLRSPAPSASVSTGCACCIPSEGAVEGERASSPVPWILVRPVPVSAVRAGVDPAPYRPPLVA
jgi:hypothetical protein